MAEYYYTSESQVPTVIPAGTTYVPVLTPGANSTTNYMMMILVVAVVALVVYMAMKK
jgi:hypothetical protein